MSVFSGGQCLARCSSAVWGKSVPKSSKMSLCVFPFSFSWCCVHFAVFFIVCFDAHFVLWKSKKERSARGDLVFRSPIPFAVSASQLERSLPDSQASGRSCPFATHSEPEVTRARATQLCLLFRTHLSRYSRIASSELVEKENQPCTDRPIERDSASALEQK